jgi:hypothetical protein
MSKPKFFRKSFAGTEEMRRLQTDIENAIAETIKSPLLNGRQLDNISLTSGDNKIEHKLARKIRGYIVSKKSNAATIYNSSDDEKFLTLNTSANVTVSLWVY